MACKNFRFNFSMKFTGVLLIVFLAGFLGSLGVLQAEAAAEIDLFEQAFENRPALIRGEADHDITISALDYYIYQFEPVELEALAESDHLQLLKTEEAGMKTLNSISLEEAREDVDFLIKTLRYGYAGYQIYGGDERFGQAHQEIIADLETASADGGYISMTKFEEILYTGLNFILPIKLLFLHL